MKYYLKRGKWCVRDGSGLRKFSTEEEARMYVESKEPTPYVEIQKYFAEEDDTTEEVE
jgi:hypothetical protein